MNDNARRWLNYAEDNLACARIILESGYLNPALQNAQQATEKALKALIIERELGLRKTHSVQELRDALQNAGTNTALQDEECEFLDSVYLPSKYPLGSALPANEPDRITCERSITIAARVVDLAKKAINQRS